MSAADTRTVEFRLSRVEALLMAMSCIAAKGDEGNSVGDICEHLELMAKEELTKATAAIGTDVLNWDC